MPTSTLLDKLPLRPKEPEPSTVVVESTELDVPLRFSTPPDLRTTRSFFTRASSWGWAVVGFVVVIGLWAFLTRNSTDLPQPGKTAQELWKMASNPFYDNGPNDRGVGLQLGASLKRVALGFGLASVAGAVVGLILGTSLRAWKAFNPIVNFLRPVSPLAWFPIWLTAMKDAPKAAVWVIFVTALWPTILNTAAGASSVPKNHRNVAKVFSFNRRTYLRRVLVPHTLPSVITGLRLSMGVSWMVIVAVEMLSGGGGIGAFVWDSYNAGSLTRVVCAIGLIGIVGVAFDAVFLKLGRMVSPAEVHA